MLRRDGLQSPFSPLTDTQKWLVFAALIPLCHLISFASLYLRFGRLAAGDDILAGYLMLPFSLPYAFLYSISFGNTGWDGAAHAGTLALFWLPFLIVHLVFFTTRQTWSLAVLVFVWLLAAFNWHYFALVLMGM